MREVALKLEILKCDKLLNFLNKFIESTSRFEDLKFKVYTFENKLFI